MSAPTPGACDLSVLHQHVKAYCHLGWRVLPTLGKRPTLKKWPETATSDYGKAKAWFNSPTNIGIATGEHSAIVVLDIDPRNGGELSLKKLEKELGRLPDTVNAKTGGNGRHLVFQWFDRAKSSKPESGIDFQANGKMIVVAPSIHPDTDKPYQWLVSPLERNPAILPDNWQSYLSDSQALPETSTTPILEGTRNDTLFQLGCQWRKGGISKQKLISQLHETNIRRCSPRLPDDEVNAIIEQCLKYDSGKQSLLTRWQNAVLSAPDLKPYEKIVLWGLGSFADQHGGSCYPNIEHIAERTCICYKTVRNHLDAHVGIWFDRYTQPQTSGKWSYGYQLKLPDRN